MDHKLSDLEQSLVQPPTGTAEHKGCTDILPWKTDSNHLIWFINIAWRKTSYYPYKNKLRGHLVHFLSILISLGSDKKVQTLQKAQGRCWRGRHNTFFLRLSDRHGLSSEPSITLLRGFLFASQTSCSFKQIRIWVLLISGPINLHGDVIH